MSGKQSVLQTRLAANVQWEDKSSNNEILISPPAGWLLLDLRELIEYRELLYFLIWRDLKVRYKQTVLGVAWAILQPLLAMLVFSVFFGWFAGMSSDGVPYPLFAYTALVPWTFFANAVAQASNSLIEHERMLTKVYFPRLFIPLAAVLSGLVNFCIAFVMLIGLMMYYGLFPTLAILTVPLFVLLAAISAFAVSLWLSALNVRYRDVRYIVPFLLQLWLFITPIVYSISIIPERWRPFYSLNPMVGVVEGFRWALFKGADAPNGMLFISALIMVLLLVSGLFYFRRVEDTFADVI